MDRVLRLSLILQKLGSIKGEKNFQKLIYLLQSKGDDLGYRFHWNIFGPVSFQLDKDIQKALRMGFIRKQDIGVPVFYSDISSQKSEFWNKKLAQMNISENLQSGIINAARLIQHSQKHPNKIEILASIDYLQKTKGLSVEDATNNYRSLVGERFTETEIEDSLNLKSIFDRQI